MKLFQRVLAMILPLFSALIAASFPQAALAQTFTVLQTFTPAVSGSPYVTTLFPAISGNLYGTTYNDGTSKKGTIFQITSSGVESVLYNFTGLTDGGFPFGIVADAAENLYGVAAAGGVNRDGVVFKYSNTGTYSVIYNFDGIHGKSPAQYAPLSRDAAGNLYGVTVSGGTGNNGVLFKVTPAGNETVLFNVPAGQLQPFGPFGMIRSGGGNFYGASETNAEGLDPHGSVFEVSAAGVESTLYSFCVASGCPDGSTPETRLALDATGNIYGTTLAGGLATGIGEGVIFELPVAGGERVLYTFSGAPEGAGPSGPLIRDGKGNLYAAAVGGGSQTCNCGTVTELSAVGQATVLHSFTGGADGGTPANLARDSKGNLYGATDGYKGKAVVFEIAP